VLLTVNPISTGESPCEKYSAWFRLFWRSPHHWPLWEPTIPLAPGRSTSQHPSTPRRLGRLKTLTAVREAVPGGVKVTTTGERTDGTAINTNYVANYDGTPGGVLGKGAPYDTVSIKQVDDNTFTYEAKSAAGKYSARGRVVISSDGKTMTMTATGTDADGKTKAVTLVYDKQ
jgi:hypothetical protein